MHPTLNHCLDRAAASWRWQSVIKSISTIISLSMLVAFAIGGSVLLDWVTTAAVAYFLLGITFVVSGMAALAMLIRSVEKNLSPNWLASEIEKREPPLLDRLNTILELDQQPENLSATMYREAIENQAASVVWGLPEHSPFPWSTTRLHFAIAVFFSLATIYFYAQMRPLKYLAARSDAAQLLEEKNSPAISIPNLDKESSEGLPLEDDGDPWGQVRISEPGRDLRMTRFEDLQLFIEAASDRPLTDVHWSTFTQSDDETRHDLPAFDDPRYASFQPILQPEKLGLKEWDLVSYRAAAVTNDESHYESSTFFVEVVPSRDELDKLPEAVYEQLNKITQLIEQQQKVIRNTESLKRSENMQSATSFDLLADQEDRIYDAAARLQIALEDRLGPEATSPFVDSISEAQESLRNAEAVLRDRDSESAIDHEHTALMQLAQSRKQLADLLDDHLTDFESSALDDIKRSRVTPADPEFAKLLQKLEKEARETSRAAGELEKLADEQRELLDEVRQTDGNHLQQFATRQEAIHQEFEALRSSHNKAFHDLTAMSNQTENALREASQSLNESSSNPEPSIERAESHLRELGQEMNRRRLANETARSTTLQQRLQANREAYLQITDSAETIDSEKITQTTEETRELLDDLRQVADQVVAKDDDLAEQKKTPGAAHDDHQLPSDRTNLAETLTSELHDQINRQCDRLGQTDSTADRSATASGIENSLQQLAEALEKDTAADTTKLDQQQLASDLKRMEDRREHLNSARQSVQEALTRQRAIHRQAYLDRSKKAQYPKLAQQQADLERKLSEAIENNPAGFERASRECESVRSAMQQTAQTLRASGEEAHDLADQTAQAIQKLDDKLEQQQGYRQDSNQQFISDMLKKMAEKLEKIAESPQKFTSEQKQQTASQCQSVGSEACQLAGKQPGQGRQGSNGEGGAKSGEGASGQIGTSGQGAGGTAAGQPAGEDNTAERRQEQLKQASDRLAEANGNQDTVSAARDLQQQLMTLAAALGNSQTGRQQTVGRQPGGQQPGGQKTAGQQPRGQAVAEQQTGATGQSTSPTMQTFRDALRPNGVGAIDRGISQLETAARRSQQGTLSKEAADSLQSGAIADLIAGIRSRYGYNETSQAIVMELTEEIADSAQPVDLRTLQRLREQIQSMQHDLVTQPETSTENQSTLHVDPDNFPPDYRESIQNYYQTLSEQR